MLHFPPRNYSCTQCGESCRLFEVEIRPEIATPREHSVQMPDGSCKLLCHPDGCPHLRAAEERHICSIYPLRPQACRDFPFRATRTPGGTYIGLSFACSAVRANTGSPVEQNDKDWQELAPDQQTPDLVPGQPAEWGLYRRLEEFIGDQLCHPNGPFSAALGISLAAAHNAWDQLGQLPIRWLSDNLDLACQRTLRGLLVLTEADNQPERAHQLLLCQAQGGRYWSRIFSHWCEPEEIRGRLDQDEDEHWQDVEAFFRHLLFRKFLWGSPGVHARICLLPLLNEILRYWSWQQALALDLSRPNRSLRDKAIMELERRLTFHARGWEDYCQPLSAAFLEGVR